MLKTINVVTRDIVDQSEEDFMSGLLEKEEKPTRAIIKRLQLDINDIEEIVETIYDDVQFDNVVQVEGTLIVKRSGNIITTEDFDVIAQWRKDQEQINEQERLEYLESLRSSK
jgi:hypothetical protein